MKDECVTIDPGGGLEPLLLALINQCPSHFGPKYHQSRSVPSRSALQIPATVLDFIPTSGESLMRLPYSAQHRNGVWTPN